MSKTSVKVGLFGLGTVGGGVAELLLREEARLARRLGLKLELAKAWKKGIPIRFFSENCEEVADL